MAEVDLSPIIVLDIETTPGFQSLADAPADHQAAWRRRIDKRNERRGEAITPEAAYDAEAGLDAAFGRVIAFAIGTFDGDAMKVFGVGSHNERDLLCRFLGCCNTVNARSRGRLTLVGHNIRGFDIAYLARRLLVHGLAVPEVLSEAQGKPEWYSRHEDTLELWNFACRDRISLDALCCALGVPTPKGGIDGSKVRDAFYDDGALQTITDYCARDVAATAHVYRRLKQLPPINPANVTTTLDVDQA